jgi:hypothetical protein
VGPTKGVQKVGPQSGLPNRGPSWRYPRGCPPKGVSKGWTPSDVPPRLDLQVWSPNGDQHIVVHQRVFPQEVVHQRCFRRGVTEGGSNRGSYNMCPPRGVLEGRSPKWGLPCGVPQAVFHKVGQQGRVPTKGVLKRSPKVFPQGESANCGSKRVVPQGGSNKVGTQGGSCMGVTRRRSCNGGFIGCHRSGVSHGGPQ